MRGVLFDLGGTLLDYAGSTGWQRVLESAYRAVHDVVVGAGHRGGFAAFQDRMWQVEQALWEAARAGTAAPTMEVAMAEVVASLGLASDPSVVARCVRAYELSLRAACEVYPDSASTLAALKERGLRVGLVSNTLLAGEFHVADLARFGLLDHLDDLVFSSEVGAWKPQPRVFHLALERLGVSAREAVFVGDRLIDDVGGAQTAGCLGVLKVLPGEEADYAEGEALGIVPDGRIQMLSELPSLIDALASRR